MTNLANQVVIVTSDGYGIGAATQAWGNPLIAKLRGISV